MTDIQIQKPRKVFVPLAEGLRWCSDGKFLFLEKYDGRWVEGGLPFNGNLLLAERMTGTHGVWYAAHTVANIAGQNVLGESTRTRWRELQRIARDFEQPAGPDIRLAASGAGGEFLQAVLAQGGEGVCAFDLDAPWGQMWACKRLESFHCEVTGFCGGSQTVAISRVTAGQPCGHVALRGGKVDQVRIGSIIKVEGQGLTADGQIREPRPCKDSPTSWLVKF